MDIPIIRLAEVYLNYAEAIARAGGNTGEALARINELRARAGAPLASAADLTHNLLWTKDQENCIGKDCEDLI